MTNIDKLLDNKELEKIKKLRKKLNDNPEASGYEVKTREIIYDFLLANTSKLKIEKTDTLVYAYLDRESEITIGIQSEHDAIIDMDGNSYHGCGHDGHTAIACGLAMAVEKMDLTSNIIFIFQPSEENGQGALQCLYLLDEYKVDYIYGFHNFPGNEFGKPILRSGTFMCASEGIEVYFKGKQAHASEPEKGINPIYAIGKIINKLEPLSQINGYKEFAYKERVFATIIHTHLGNEGTYGVSPSDGKLQMTLRANKEDDIEDLQEKLQAMSKKLGEEYNLDYKISYNDKFPDTSNPQSQIYFLDKVFKANNIEPIYWEEPFRSSDDFGWYLKKVPGCYFGIGSGEDSLNLHNIDYEFDDRLIKIAIQYFIWIVENI